MPPKIRSAIPRGQLLNGDASDAEFRCPECEVVLSSGVRFSYALGILRSQGWHVHGCAHAQRSHEWTVAAAKRGQTEAQRDLGLRYIAGREVPQNFVRAYGWLNLAAAAGDAKARESREALLRRMTRGQVAEAQRLSTDWYERLQPGKTG
jgi:TPR repeat protein